MRLSFNEEEVHRAMSLYKVFARAFKSVSEHSIRDSKEHGFNPTEFAVLELLYTRGSPKAAANRLEAAPCKRKRNLCDRQIGKKRFHQTRAGPER